MDEEKYRFHLKILQSLQVVIFVLFATAFVFAYYQLESVKNDLCRNKNDKTNFVNFINSRTEDTLVRQKRQVEENKTRKAKIHVILWL